MRTSTNTVLAAAAFATLALARTDLEGCTRTDVSSPAGASYAWYVPGTGEVCEILDCGGGRAPPKTTVPGCAAYSGTETYSPSYLAGFQASATAAPSTTADAEQSSSSSVNWSALETDTAVSSWDLYTTLGSATGPITDSPTASEPEATSSAVVISDSSAVTTITDASSVAAITDASSAATDVVVPESSTLVAQTTAAGIAPSNGTVSSGRPGSNGTASNGTASPSAPISDSGVAGSAQAWIGSAGLMMGLAGLVAFL
jgi:hypothetical protein